MTNESEPRIDERPATHKKKLQTWLMVAFGLVLGLLLILTVINIAQKTRGDDAAATSEDAGKQTAERNKSKTDPSKSDAFGQLVDNRPPTRERHEKPSDAFSQLQSPSPTSVADRENSTDGSAGKKSETPKLTAEEKALRQWRSREKLRALNSAQAQWGFKTVAAGSGKGRSQKSFDEVSRPLNDKGSVEQRRTEVRQRIEQAKKLRKELLAKSQAGSAPPAPADLQQKQQNLSAVTKQFDEPPENVAGYTDENTYNADIDGKMKLPPGTVIPAVFGQKAISDYDGSTIKGMITHDIYDLSSQYVLIPKGTDVIMKVNRIQNVNEAIQARMGITVETGVLPNGKVIDFSKATGMDREGVGAIKDQVNYHFMAQFLGVAAYALVSSESSREGSGLNNNSTYAGDVGSSVREQFAPLAQRYIGLVPTITIRPGQNFRIMLEDSIYVEPWKDLYAQYIN